MAARIAFEPGLSQEKGSAEFHQRSLRNAYEVRSRKDHRGVDLISDALPFIIALIVGGVLVLTAVAAAVIVNLFPRRPK